MYQYAPKSEKKTETLLLLITSLLGVFCFVCSKLPGMVYPFILQAISLGFFAFSIINASKYRLTRFVYSIETGHDGATELVVVQHSGRRMVTVCRIPLSSVCEVTTATRENIKHLMKTRRQKTVYRYTGEMFLQRGLMLDVEYGGESFGLLILSDETLERILRNA